MTELPTPVAALVGELATMRGAVAVVLGGSRATGMGNLNSDWDIGLYYRGTIDLAALQARGQVHPPGSWGRLMNGGAWLQCEDHRVDVLLRDLDVVEHWTQAAGQGEFEVDALLGYLAGMPTYTLAAELASCRVLWGALPGASYPPALKASAPARWRFCRSFSLAYAQALAQRGNVVAAMGQVAKAAMEEAHARLCERGEWICNEKRLLDAAGLAALHPLFAQAPQGGRPLAEWIDGIGERLGAAKDATAPWMGG